MRLALPLLRILSTSPGNSSEDSSAPANAILTDTSLAIAGFAADVEQYEDFKIKTAPRKTSIRELETGRYRADPEDSPNGFYMSGNLPTSSAQGVHSLVDVGVYAFGAGASTFNGMQDRYDRFLRSSVEAMSPLASQHPDASLT